MSQRDQTIIGILALTAIIGVYIVALARALAQKTPVVPETLPSLTKLERDIVPVIMELELNGQLPVTVNPEELGKDNPFTPLQTKTQTQTSGTPSR